MILSRHKNSGRFKPNGLFFLNEDKNLSNDFYKNLQNKKKKRMREDSFTSIILNSSQ